MTGSWDSILDAFHFQMQEDYEYFSYYNLDEDQTKAVIHERSIGFLKEAITRLLFSCTPDVDFNDYNEAEEKFNFELTNEEINLLSSLMFERYLAKGMARLRIAKNALTSQDIKYAFSPYRERNSFVSMYKDICAENDKLIDRYISKDRLTGERKYPKYDEE